MSEGDERDHATWGNAFAPSVVLLPELMSKVLLADHIAGNCRVI